MTTLIRATLGAILPSDTCEICPAPARLAVLIGDKNGIPVGPLMFCKHHGDRNEKALNSMLILDVIDNREEAKADPSKEQYAWIEDLLQ